MDVLLVMFKSDGARRDFQITKNRIIIGRKTDCDLRIPLSSVSRHHCELTVDHDQQQVALRDLGSSNGTYHNNVRMQEAVLTAGDEIMVGPVVFTVVIDGEPSAIEPVRSVLDTGNTEPSVGPGSSDAAEIEPDEAGDEAGAIDVESHSPTVDLDEDPIAALQRLADQEDEESDRPA